MKNQRCKPNQLYRNAVVTACQVSLVVLLSACGSGNDSEPSTPIATGFASVSAAQLAADGTTTLSIAQATAAGLVPAQSVATQNGEDTTAQVIPEVGAALPTEPVQPAEPAAPIEPVVTASPNDNDSTETPAVSEPAVEPEPAPATPVAATNPEDTSGQTVFTATNTDGFVGEVLDDGVVKVTWQKDPTARGYNVFRQAKYITTVFAEEYIDTDTFDESYYYEIQAFDYDENYNYVAVGLTVNVSGTGRVNPDSPKPKENILDGYELVFSEEFNGSELDSSKWVTQYLWGDELVINSEEQHYVDIQNKPDFGYNPFSFDGEAITISAIETPDDLKDKAFGQKYLSGVITSYDSFKFTYGYVEARVQLPFGRGLWPAFWLLNAYYVDDKPEIDIMEFIGHNQDVAYHTYHYYDGEGNLRSTESEGTVGIDFTNGWHTFAVEWLPGQLIFYVDGIERHRVIDSKVSQQEMYIIANTALGGWWPGSPDSSTPFPAEYKIDYIRAYQRVGEPLADPTEGLPSQLKLWDDVPNTSPSHLPPFELWPEGYPERG